MTALGLIIGAAGVALIWGGITGRPIMTELRAALGNPSPNDPARGRKKEAAKDEAARKASSGNLPSGAPANLAGAPTSPTGPLGPVGPQRP